jgi:hypothetical protein
MRNGILQEMVLIVTAYFLTFEASSSALALALFSLFPTRRASLHAFRNLTYCSTSFSVSSMVRSETTEGAAGRGIGTAVLDCVFERSGF